MGFWHDSPLQTSLKLSRRVSVSKSWVDLVVSLNRASACPKEVEFPYLDTTRANLGARSALVGTSVRGARRFGVTEYSSGVHRSMRMKR